MTTAGFPHSEICGYNGYLLLTAAYRSLSRPSSAKSIIEHLSSDSFPRIKIGVGQKPSPDYDLVNWVLGKFPKADYELIAQKYPDIYSSVELIIMGKIEEAMNKYSK